MAYFTVRAFVPEPKIGRHTADDYQRLHDAFLAINLYRYIKGDDGVFYDLPPGEYSGEGNLTAKQVQEMASNAMNKARMSGHVLVSRCDQRAWVLAPQVAFARAS